jgi:FAD/FMN-containing dehydrogenase
MPVELNRRRLLGLSGIAVAAAVVPLSAGCSFIRDDNGLSSLATDFDGSILLPGDPGFALAAWPNNANYADVIPKAVAICASTADISRCITWVRDTGSVFAVRSGGHSYAGFSTTSGLLIDVRYMNAVTFDPATGLVQISAGANNQEVANCLRPHGVSYPGGRCPTVGIGGLILGGGWGFAATRHGATCDSLVATDVVLADATVVTASPEVNADLFWGVRGAAGGNLGVNAGFSLQTYAAPNVTVFTLTWPPAKQVELMDALQTLQIDHPKNLSTRQTIVMTAAVAKPSPEQLCVTAAGLYWGSKADLIDALQPVLAVAKPAPAEGHIAEMTYWEGRDFLATNDPQGLYVSKNSFLGERMSIEGLNEMVYWMRRWPGGSVAQMNMGLIFAFGGAVRDLPTDAMAYVHRNSNFLLQIEPEWTPRDSPQAVAAMKSWLDDYYEAMQPYVLPESYQNFPDRSLADFGSAYYGTNLSRLQSVKRAYDPDNVFSFAQSIPLPSS